MKVRPHAIAAICLSIGLCAQAAGTDLSSLTANELYDHARLAFTQRDHATALEAYRKLAADFGQSPAVQEAIQKSKHPVAICCVRLGKFDEAIPAIEEALALQPPLDQGSREELQFWLGCALFQQERHPEARSALEVFLAGFPAGAEDNAFLVRTRPAVRHIADARLLVGNALILEGRHAPAAEWFGQMRGGSGHRGKAVLYQLHALLQIPDHAAALALVQEEYPRMAEIPQIASFQMLTLELGNRFLEAGELRKAALCFQRVWTRDRLLRHQDERAATLQKQIEALGDSPDVFRKGLLERTLREIQRESENLRPIKGFDAALRFRLAMVYLHMQRYREASLVLENLVASLPTDVTTELAGINVVRCRRALEDSPGTVRAADQFAEKFPASKFVPEARFLAAESLQASLRPAEAATAFARIREDHPASEFGVRAAFNEGFCQLLAEQNSRAGTAFEEFRKNHPQHPLAESALYWRGMAFSMDKDHERAIETMRQLLKKHPDGTHMGQAVFRIAYSKMQQEKYGEAADAFHEYLERFPGEAENNEARIHFANALMNDGYMEDGLEVLRAVPPGDERYYAEATFRSAEALKLLEDLDAYRNLMQDFVKRFPKSPRVAEAIANLGWYHRQKEEPAKAREIAWEAIRSLGNDPAIRSVEELFPFLAHLSSAPEDLARHREDLESLAENPASKRPLRLRARWALAATWKKSDPARFREILREAVPLADVSADNPAVLLDLAQADLDGGDSVRAERLLRDTLRWNPRTLVKDRILAHLARIEMDKGNERAALDLFERFERENLGSALFAPTMMAKARLLLHRGKVADARRALEQVLEQNTTPGEMKAEALYLMGESHLDKGEPAKAIPYFQRLYVMHGRWKPWVAKAYLRSGEAFEKMPDPLSARRTYAECVNHPDLADFPETLAARQHLDRLGGPPQKPASTPGG